MCKTTRKESCFILLILHTSQPIHFILLSWCWLGGANRDQNKQYPSYTTSPWKQLINIQIATLCVTLIDRKHILQHQDGNCCVYDCACAFAKMFQMCYFEVMCDTRIVQLMWDCYCVWLALRPPPRYEKKENVSACETCLCTLWCMCVHAYRPFVLSAQICVYASLCLYE